jgi:hypothetical protein
LFDRKDDDPNLIAARADAEGALPEGWKLAEEDREGFLLVGPETQISLDVWAAAAKVRTESSSSRSPVTRPAPTSRSLRGFVAT